MHGFILIDKLFTNKLYYFDNLFKKILTQTKLKHTNELSYPRNCSNNI